MTYEIRNYDVREETFLKLSILCRGIVFTSKALEVANLCKAKGQNLVYNMPIGSNGSRPQELIIRNITDSYETVVSCVAPNSMRKAVLLDVDEKGLLKAYIDNCLVRNVEINFVKEPLYYRRFLNSGDYVKKYVSACGLDELNIIPWKGCNISKLCRFCGINNYIEHEDITAQIISGDYFEWERQKSEYLLNLNNAVKIALDDNCYDEHAHVILISGNLANDSLDYQAKVFSEIANSISSLVIDKSNEGIVAVMSPPKTYSLMHNMKQSGINKVVFNLEAVTEEGFKKYCPGKAELGYGYYLERLIYAVEVFGKGNVWSNLVFGLESLEDTILGCERLINNGIVVSANILHLDKGNSLDCTIPDECSTLDFFHRLNELNVLNNFAPFYCQKALRTSLSNEIFAHRVEKGKLF